MPIARLIPRLFITRPTNQFTAYLVSETSAQEVVLTTNDLRTLILNHIGTEYPQGVARKEFIKNLAGNYIIVNNQTQEVSGMSPTTFGYKGLEGSTCHSPADQCKCR